MSKICKSIVFFLVLAFSGCYYDVEEELYPTLDCATDNVTYSGVVASIIQQNCNACHSAAANFGNVTLEGYENLKNYVDNGRLLGAIRHVSGFSPMPQNQPPLVECTIQKIEAWIQDGAPNN
ncbi:MAG: hypothetical protein R2795_06835 [Saprospiraceae bacterium]